MIRSISLLLALVGGLLIVAGCDTVGFGDTAAVGKRDQAFAHYYPLMTDAQRVDFAALRREQDRHDFVKRHGLDIALYLDQHMRTGMAPRQVAELLGDPWSVEGHTAHHGARAGEHLAWFYRSFEGVSRPIVYSVRFHDEEVEGWSVWRSE